MFNHLKAAKQVGANTFEIEVFGATQYSLAPPVSYFGYSYRIAIYAETAGDKAGRRQRTDIGDMRPRRIANINQDKLFPADLIDGLQGRAHLKRMQPAQLDFPKPAIFDLVDRS